MLCITISKHARQRLKERLGLPKRALQRFLGQRINSPDVIDPLLGNDFGLRQGALSILKGHRDQWVSFDTKRRLFYLWGIGQRQLILITVLYPYELRHLYS